MPLFLNEIVFFLSSDYSKFVFVDRIFAILELCFSFFVSKMDYAQHFLSSSHKTTRFNRIVCLSRPIRIKNDFDWSRILNTRTSLVRPFYCSVNNCRQSLSLTIRKGFCQERLPYLPFLCLNSIHRNGILSCFISFCWEKLRIADLALRALQKYVEIPNFPVGETSGN